LEKLLQDHFQRDTNKNNEQNLASRWKLYEKGDLIFLPHYEPPRYGTKETDFPYHFLTYQLLVNPEGRSTHLPLIQELSGVHSRIYSNSWIEINPEIAHKLGIIENEEVYIVSPKGRLRAKTKILPSVMPDTIMMPFGFGHKAFGKDKKALGANPYEIFEEDSDLMCGITSFISTKVRLEKVIA
jgi:anaerobic selenocysteine-containing dehydrogenase